MRRTIVSLLVLTLARAASAGEVSVFANGFENAALCLWSSAVDFPAVYVSTSDPNATTGASCGLDATAPCTTIAAGLASAVANTRCQLFVAGGDYFESVTLVAGVRLRGGFDPVTWVHSPGSQTSSIRGSSGAGDRAAVSAVSLSGAPVVVEQFAIAGAHATAAGANSYAVRITGSSAPITIRDNEIVAGDGADGGSGSTGGDGEDGADGTGRIGNESAYDAKVATGTGVCNATNNRSHDNGGVRVCGADDVSGGDGGGNSCPPSSTLTEQSAQDGSGGQPASGGATAGAGGDAGDDLKLDEPICQVPAQPLDGASGTNGSAGANGASGAGCSSSGGSVVAGHWRAGSAASGAVGANGGGGGGGGAGGGAFCFGCDSGKDQLGGHGGGGGSGGCGGTGGGAGQSGGGSFGIFVVGGTAPVLVDNLIERGDGGDGGFGGSGGARGEGAAGGLGGIATIFCAGAAGAGGAGGDGGHGAGGGGGCGGASFGIYTSGLGTSLDYCQPAANNTILFGSAGSGRTGGLSLGNGGGTGSAGVLGNCSFN